jgi:5'(3')-deoxyribonucleotidase
MDNQPIFAIDCDEVLRRTLDKMVELYNKHFGANKTVEDVKDFKTEISFPEIEEVTGKTASQWFFQEHSTELFLETEPYPHIKEDIDRLRKYGKVVILTYQKSYQNKMETLLWLEKQGIECDGICFLKDKTLLCADYLVDDNDWNFLNSRVQHGILVTAPYNKDKVETDVLTNSNMHTITRVSSLHEFVDAYVNAQKSIEEAKKIYTKKQYTLTSSIPYDYHGETLYFSRVDEKVFIGNYFILGVNACARIQLVGSWPDCIVKVEDLNKYLK